MNQIYGSSDRDEAMILETLILPMQAYINGKPVAIPTAIVASRLHPAASASSVRQHVGNASTCSVHSNERRILFLVPVSGTG